MAWICSGGRGAGQQALPEMGQVPIRIPGRGDPFVHLEDMHVGPGHLLVGEGPQHLPGGSSTADSKKELSSGGDGLACLCGDDAGCGTGDAFGIRQDLGCNRGHHETTSGFHHPPAGMTSVPNGGRTPGLGAYSKTGVPAFSTGSTIRQASP